MKTGELRATWLRSQLQHVRRKYPSTGRAVEQAGLTPAHTRSLSRRLYLSIARKTASSPRLMSAPERGEGGAEVWGEGFLFKGPRRVEPIEVCKHDDRIQTGKTAALIRAGSKTVDPCACLYL